MINQIKWALVTGASSGIGKEMSEVLAQKGWNLILVARREELLIKVKENLEKKYSVKIEIVKSDLSLAPERTKILALFNQYPIRFFINNAGIFSRESFDQTGFESATRLIDLNIVALTHLTHGAVREMKKLNVPCTILNVGSLNSFIAVGDSAIYAATKAFVKSFSVALSEELRSTLIHCACLCPGGTETEILSSSGVDLDSKGQKFLMPAMVVARIGIEGALNKKVLIVPGFSNKFSVFLSKILPETFMTMISTRVLAQMMGKIKS